MLSSFALKEQDTAWQSSHGNAQKVYRARELNITTLIEPQ